MEENIMKNSYMRLRNCEVKVQDVIRIYYTYSCTEKNLIKRSWKECIYVCIFYA